MKTVLMQSCVAWLFLITPAGAVAVSVADLFFLSDGLQPEVVATTLVRVEDEWRSQAAAFADCDEKTGDSKACTGPQRAFTKSCSTVVEAMVKGSSGDHNRVSDYMGLVCGQRSFTGWHQDRCLELKQVIGGALQFNEYANRMNFNAVNVCTNYWSNFAKEEQKRAKEQREAQKEEEKAKALVAQELAKKAEEEAKAKAIADKKQQEEARKQALEVHNLALERREKAEEQAKKDATRTFASKRAEAEKLAKLAHDKVKKAAEEAAKAAEEHQKLVLEHQKAEEHLKKVMDANQHQQASPVNLGLNNATAVNATIHTSNANGIIVVPVPTLSHQAKTIVVDVSKVSRVVGHSDSGNLRKPLASAEHPPAAKKK